MHANICEGIKPSLYFSKCIIILKIPRKALAWHDYNPRKALVRHDYKESHAVVMP